MDKAVEKEKTGSDTYKGQIFDVMLHSWFSRFIGWLSPASSVLAMFDWWAHLTIAPAKQFDIAANASQRMYEFMMCLAQYFGGDTSALCIKCRPSDKRFSDELWNRFPFNAYAINFLLWEQFWDDATENIRGVSSHHLQMVNFAARQILDTISPSNFLWTNPEVLSTTFTEKGANLVNGFKNYIADLARLINKHSPAGTEHFQVGVNVAITPGKIIYQNQLIELIQYDPTTAEVYADPILIIPAWIMKYYILDLTPHNSLVKYLVDKGHTVFMISWKNPRGEDRNLGLEDYLNLGILDALKAVNAIMPERKVHTVGYCIGGTLLMIAAAVLAKKDHWIKSITLFAAEVDFKEAGELMLFMDQSQISYLEDIMWEKGYLDGTQMAGAFSMLHSNDLIWSRMIHDYLLGKRRPMTALVAWDLDTTRLPLRMHSEYLHDLFLKNELVQGNFKVDKKKIALIDIDAPIFAVGTVKDHVSPWKSVYKIHLFTDTEVTFVLTTGGHNAGIVSEPGHPRRSYQIGVHKPGERYITSEHWQERTSSQKGSWWPAWQEWLVKQSDEKMKPPSMGNSKKGYTILGDAPGTYVLEK